jgi:hypothetical protein
MIPTSTQDGTLLKLFGNPSDELPDAAYRVAAKNLIEKIFEQLVELADDATPKQVISDQQSIAKFLKDPQGRILGELATGFVLSAILEFAPSTATLDPYRRMLAYNLRVQSYQGVGDAGLNGLIQRWQRKRRELQAIVDNTIKELAGMRGQVDGTSLTGGQRPPGSEGQWPEQPGSTTQS